MAAVRVVMVIIPILINTGLVISQQPTFITIAGVLSSREHQQIFHAAVELLNNERQTLKNEIHFNSTFEIMSENPIVSAIAICERVLPKHIYAVIASHPPGEFTQPPVSISYTCGFYHIPVIGITARDSVLSDKNLHGSYLRTVPPYSHQAKVWLDIVRHFKWKKVILIHGQDQEGRAMVASFQNNIQLREPIVSSIFITLRESASKIDFCKTIDYVPGAVSYTDILKKIALDSTIIYLLSASKQDAETIFKDTSRLNMTQEGSVWILTEQAMNASNIPIGALGLKLQHGKNEEYHIKDSVKIIGKAFNKVLQNKNLTAPPISCNESVTDWKNSGDMLLKQLLMENVEGLTGEVSFTDSGDRRNPKYDIINIHENDHVIVGHYGQNQDGWSQALILNESMMIWPGGRVSTPEGYKFSTYMKVVTIESIPFINVRPVNSKLDCDVANNEVYCPKPHQNNPDKQFDYCCTGYCIDLLIEISTSENFTFDMYLVPDNKFGSLDRVNGSSERQWNGLMGELVNGRADMIVAPMTIDPDRAQYVDFTKPFKYQGITILVKKAQKESSLDSFLQPFKDTLWILVVLSVHVVALVLYLLDRFSPFGRFKLAKSNDTQEDALNLSSAMWFAWGVLLNSGIGEGTPRSFSARVLGMVWAGFAMIIVASYTANLAAFLVLDRPEASITGIDDARLRNPQKDFTFSTVKNSAVLGYFKRHVELSTMYRTMEDHLYETPEAAIKDIMEDRLSAFIWDSTRLEYEAARSCDLITAGDLFGRSGFAIGLPRKSPWLNRISVKILQMHEVGSMETLDTKWILHSTECIDHDSSPATLGLTNMAGVFMLVAGGIVAGVFLIFIEIAYKKHRGMKEKELEVARSAAQRWRGNIERRKVRREIRRKLKEELDQKHSAVRNGKEKLYEKPSSRHKSKQQPQQQPQQLPKSVNPNQMATQIVQV
ncbi:glutamate receptor ionotropic, NMDA 1-like [Tubulanus polymorphus]|uniref:glutamate receptor ionotropic, NMDA 1-like n=1 Tax=Tubulanus polymorphus TaxID=672921 RepID=UPI003DA569F0